MLIVVKGMVVDGRNIIEVGGELVGLTPEAEEQLIAEGVAKRVSDCEIAEIGPEDERAPEVDAAIAQGAEKPASLEELKARCRELGLPTRGKKADLIARIEEAEAAIDGEEADVDEPPVLKAEVPR